MVKVMFALLVLAAGSTVVARGYPLVADYEGDISRQGWKLKAEEAGKVVYIPFEGYYESKGGRIESPVFKLDKGDAENAWYALSFEAKGPVDGYWWVDLFDRNGELLPDVNSRLYASDDWRAYDVVLPTNPNAVTAQIAFVSKAGVHVRNVRMRRVSVDDAAVWCDRLYATLPQVEGVASDGGWSRLPKTMRALNSSGALRIVFLGDSIMNDTWCGNFGALVKRDFPNVDLKMFVSVRGSTGCWYYHEKEHFDEYVAKHRPDLVVIGGISNWQGPKRSTVREAEDWMVETIGRCKAIGAEVVVCTPPPSYEFRKDEKAVPFDFSLCEEGGMQHLRWDFHKNAARRTGVPLWDLTTGPCETIARSGKPLNWFKRDSAHNDDRGKQLIARTMASYFRMAAGLPYATPEAQGVSSRAILDWIEACEATSATNGFKGGYLHGFVIVRHGKVIAEGSWAPQDTLNEPHMLYSHSKSFTATAIGFLVDDGKLDLDERVVDLFPDKMPAQPSENLRQLRVRDLLTMNTGAERTDAEGDDIRADWIRAILANEFQHAPGTVFRYDSAATHLLAAIAERKSGRKLMDFLGERLFRPLGMTSPWSTVSPEGVACGGWGMNMTTRDMAKFGQFLLQKGVWEGKQLLSSEWIELATARQTWSSRIVVASQVIGSGSDWAQGYGFQFWRCRHDAFRADGAMGQLTVVFPEEDAVVSVNAGLRDMPFELNLIWQYLLPAFGDTVLPEDPTASSALATKCATLALPLDDPTDKPFLDMDKAAVERTADGWTLAKDGRRLAVGDGKWTTTEWRFSDDLVEPLFGWCGTRKIAANGRLDEDGALLVSWQFLGGVAHGCFKVPADIKRTQAEF